MICIRLGLLLVGISCLPAIRADESACGGKIDTRKTSGVAANQAVTNQIQGGRVMKEHRSGEWSPGLTED